MELSPGMKVVCIKDDLVFEGIRPLKKGRVYTIRNVRVCCDRLTLDVGVASPCFGTQCVVCELPTNDFVWWITALRFRPLDQLEQQLENIMTEPIEEPELQEA